MVCLLQFTIEPRLHALFWIPDFSAQPEVTRTFVLTTPRRQCRRREVKILRQLFRRKQPFPQGRPCDRAWRRVVADFHFVFANTFRSVSRSARALASLSLSSTRLMGGSCSGHFCVTSTSRFIIAANCSAPAGWPSALSCSRVRRADSIACCCSEPLRRVCHSPILPRISAGFGKNSPALRYSVNAHSIASGGCFESAFSQITNSPDISS